MYIQVDAAEKAELREYKAQAAFDGAHFYSRHDLSQETIFQCGMGVDYDTYENELDPDSTRWIGAGLEILGCFGLHFPHILNKDLSVWTKSIYRNWIDTQRIFGARAIKRYQLSISG